MPELEWVPWVDGYLLRIVGTQRHRAWIEPYSGLGYSIKVWSPPPTTQHGNWERIAYHPDLETAKTIAMMYVKGNLL